jgi:predicted RNA-binding Zn ribbon-like protein
MTPETIIREAQADGVRLALSPAGTIKVTGDGAAVNRWLAMIRERKAEIIAVLEEAALRAWLSHIEETDADIIEHVIAKCRLDEDARDYFLRRALEQRGAAPKPAPVFGEPDEA